jgi:hypothetical protein
MGGSISRAGWSGSFGGTSYSGTLQSNAFAHLDFRCVVFQATDNDTRSDGANSYASGSRSIVGHAPPPSPAACQTYERGILNWAPNRIQAWHNMTCPAVKRVLHRSRIVRKGDLRAPGFTCRVLGRGSATMGATVRCTTRGRRFQLIWGP